MHSRRDVLAGGLFVVAMTALALALFAVTFATTPIAPASWPSGARPDGLSQARAEAMVRAHYAPQPSQHVFDGPTGLGRLLSAEAVHAGDRMGPERLAELKIPAHRWIWVLRFDSTWNVCSPPGQNGQSTCRTGLQGTLEVSLDFLTGKIYASDSTLQMPP